MSSTTDLPGFAMSHGLAECAGKCLEIKGNSAQHNATRELIRGEPQQTQFIDIVAKIGWGTWILT